jgi:hypothetical protein
MENFTIDLDENGSDDVAKGMGIRKGLNRKLARRTLKVLSDRISKRLAVFRHPQTGAKVPFKVSVEDRKIDITVQIEPTWRQAASDVIENTKTAAPVPA